MGGSLSRRLRSLVWGPPKMRILMNGLDAAGKTTILYKIKVGEVETKIPTIGMIIETTSSPKVEFLSWDHGGRSKIRALWRHYMANVHALVWVVDSNDRDRLSSTDEDYTTSRSELHSLLSEELLADCPLLVLANKQDLPNALTVDEVATALGLSDLRHRPWLIQGCTATSGTGIFEGLDWLAQTVNARHKTSQTNQIEPPNKEQNSNLSKSTTDMNNATMETAKTTPEPTPTIKPAIDRETEETEISQDAA